MTISGLVPPLGMMALLRLGPEEQTTAFFLTQLLYATSLASLVAKAGLDQWAFSRALAHPNDEIAYARLILERIAPLAFICTLVAASLLASPLIAVCVLCSTLLDSASAIRASELTAKSSFTRVVIASLSNAPLFIVLALIIEHHWSLPPTGAAILFVATSFLRFATLFAGVSTRNGVVTISIGDALRMGQQQLFNAMMFRGDAFIAACLSPQAFPPLASLFYFFRVVEIAGSGAILVCSSLGQTLRSVDGKLLSLMLGVWAAGAVVVSVVAALWQPVPTISWLTLVLVMGNAILSLPANFCTQLLLLRRQLRDLLTVLRRSFFAGTLVLIAIATSSTWYLLPIVCTVQFSAFILCSLLRIIPARSEAP